MKRNTTDLACDQTPVAQPVPSDFTILANPPCICIMVVKLILLTLYLIFLVPSHCSHSFVMNKVKFYDNANTKDKEQ